MRAGAPVSRVGRGGRRGGAKERPVCVEAGGPCGRLGRERWIEGLRPAGRGRGGISEGQEGGRVLGGEWHIWSIVTAAD